jgi:hypothetical protein
MNENGELRDYYLDIPDSAGDIVGGVLWNTESGTHVIYVATEGGRIYKRIDDGSSFVVPASPWDTPFSDASVTQITTAVMTDGTNLYFGGVDNTGTPRIYAVEISTKNIVTNVEAASTLRAVPSWARVDGQTYLYMASDAAGGVAHVYRVDIPDAAAVMDNTTNKQNDIVAPTTLVSGRLHVGDVAGKMHGVDADSTDFVDLTGWPYVSESGAAIRGGAYVHAATTRVYYGDASGYFYVLTPDGSLVSSDYPIQPDGTTPISSAPLVGDGVICFGNEDGKVFFVDESTAQLIRIYDFGNGVRIGDIARDFSTGRYLIGTSTGRLYCIEPESDPTP